MGRESLSKTRSNKKSGRPASKKSDTCNTLESMRHQIKLAHQLIDASSGLLRNASMLSNALRASDDNASVFVESTK